MGGVASNRAMCQASGSSSPEYSNEVFKVTCTIKQERIKDPSVLKSGDTIGVKGLSSSSSSSSSSGSSSGILGYYHVGVYVKKDPDGTHLVMDFVSDSKVRRIDLQAFTNEDERPLYRFEYIDAKPPKKDAQEIIERAQEQFLKQNFGEYNVVLNNCEHFATFCTFGKRFSYQVANAGVGDLM